MLIDLRTITEPKIEAVVNKYFKDIDLEKTLNHARIQSIFTHPSNNRIRICKIKEILVFFWTLLDRVSKVKSIKKIESIIRFNQGHKMG